MKLTPLDVKKQEFKRGLRGYDPIEVDTFLEMVSQELESLIRQKNDLADEVLKLRTQLRDYQSVEKTLQDTLMSAQASIKESKESTHREAGMIIKEAELKAEKILEDAKFKLAEMKNELVVIRSQKDSFARRLRHLLESQMELIEVLDLDDLGFARYENKASHRPAHRNPGVSSQRKETQEVEFEAVDEVIPIDQEPDTSSDAPKDDKESAHGIAWGRRTLAQDSDEENGQEERKGNKISDQLLT